MKTTLDTFELTRKSYPSDGSDEEWAFVSPYLTLMTENAPQRDYPLRESFNVLRWIVRAAAAWRLLPTNFPPWHSVYGQTHRWIKAGVFENIVDDLRALVRKAAGKKANPPPRFWTRRRCARRPRVVIGRASTAERRPKEARSILL